MNAIECPAWRVGLLMPKLGGSQGCQAMNALETCVFERRGITTQSDAPRLFGIHLRDAHCSLISDQFEFE